MAKAVNTNKVVSLVHSYIKSPAPHILKQKKQKTKNKTQNFPLKVKWQSFTYGVVSSNRLSRFFGSKLGRGKASSLWTQMCPRRCEDLADEEHRLCVEFSFISVWSCACMGLALGVSVRQEPFEWMLEGVSAKLQEDHSPRFEWVGVWTGLRWFCTCEPGRGVDVLSTHSLDLTLWMKCKKNKQRIWILAHGTTGVFFFLHCCCWRERYY